MNTDKERTALGCKLHGLRTGLKMSLPCAAKDSRLSEDYISALERSAVKFPAPFALHALAGIYGYDYKKLMVLAGHLKPKAALRGRLYAAVEPVKFYTPRTDRDAYFVQEGDDGVTSRRTDEHEVVSADFARGTELALRNLVHAVTSKFPHPLAWGGDPEQLRAMWKAIDQARKVLHLDETKSPGP